MDNESKHVLPSRTRRRDDLIDQVIDQLRGAITSGKWRVGDRIPAEPELVTALGAPRYAIREAVRALAREGLLETRQGDETFVRPHEREPLAGTSLDEQRNLLSSLLHKLRQRSGKSYREIADLTDLSPASLSRFFAAQSLPKLVTLETVVNAIGNDNDLRELVTLWHSLNERQRAFSSAQQQSVTLGDDHVQRHADLIAKLASSLQDADNAVVLLGDFLFLKVAKSIFAIEVNPSQRQMVEALIGNPAELLKQLKVDSSNGRAEAERDYREKAGQGDPQALYNLATLLASQGDDDEAEQTYLRARGVAKSTGNRLLEANVTNKLGDVAAKLRRYDEADQYYREARKIAVTVGDAELLLEILVNLGDVAVKLAHYNAAEEYYHEAHRIAVTVDNRLFLADILIKLGDVTAKVQNYSRADMYHLEARHLARSTGDQRLEANVLLKHGDLAAKQQNHSEADAYYLEARHLARSTGDQRLEASISRKQREATSRKR